LRLGHIGVPRLDPDYFAVVVMNAILGGVFNSRINLNLRERHGFTYGASSAFDWRRVAGPFVVSTAVATAVTGAAIREILAEIEAMRNAPPAADELSLVTSYLDGVFPIRFETTEAIATALTSLQAFGLPGDYYDTYRDHIRRIHSADVYRAAKTHLHPDLLQIVAVGDPDEIGPQLEALALGPVRYWSAEGSPIAGASPGGTISARDA
jgi:zinc protease